MIKLAYALLKDAASGWSNANTSISRKAPRSRDAMENGRQRLPRAQ